MKLEYLNERFLQSNPHDSNEWQVDLIRSIREKMLLPRPDPIRATKAQFNWLLWLCDINPTATSNGVEFVRVTGLNENFLDVIKCK